MRRRWLIFEFYLILLYVVCSVDVVVCGLKAGGMLCLVALWKWAKCLDLLVTYHTQITPYPLCLILNTLSDNQTIYQVPFCFHSIILLDILSHFLSLRSCYFALTATTTCSNSSDWHICPATIIFVEVIRGSVTLSNVKQTSEHQYINEA